MEKAVTTKTLDKLLLVTSSKCTSNQFAIPIVCEFICFTKTDFLQPAQIFNVLLSLIGHSCWRNLALEALVAWSSRDPMLIQQYLAENSSGITEIFRNPQPRLETESHSVSQLSRLCLLSKGIFSTLVANGLLKYLRNISAVADAKLSLDILKIIQSLIKGTLQSIYLKTHYAVIRDCLDTLKQSQKSAVVLGQIGTIESAINKLFDF
jgi:hypothetical protein